MSLPTDLLESDRVAVLGVGSDLRGDDAVGCHAARELDALRRRFRVRRLKVFGGGTAPENLTGEIARFLCRGRARRPHVVLIDAADLKLKPGAVRPLRPEQLDGVTFCTHQLPLSVLAGYLEATVPCTVSVIAIQPESLAFGAPLSPAAARAARQVAALIWRATIRLQGRA